MEPASLFVIAFLGLTGVTDDHSSTPIKNTECANKIEVMSELEPGEVLYTTCKR